MPPLLWREARAEFAGGEGIQRAEAGGKLDLGQAALAMQPPEKISRGEIVFLAVALVTAGNQVAPGIIPELCKRDDVIQAAGCGSNAAQAIKAAAAFSGVNGPAQARRGRTAAEAFPQGGCGGRDESRPPDRWWTALDEGPGGPRNLSTPVRHS